jgi:hypothetical protein
MDRIERHRTGMTDIKEAEAAGEVADSLDVRKKLLAKVSSGELTLAEAQAELRRIKRGAKVRGLRTRNSVYSRGR